MSVGLIDFIGQDNVIDSISKSMETGSLGHAYALSGPAGIGKRTLARALSKMLLCTSNYEAPCGACHSCKSFDALSNPHFKRITPKTRNILIDQIREILGDISVKPAYGRKVYLIEEADLMTAQAQNCLLKTLEEPPSYAVILMTVNRYESLLLTVRSRVVQCRLSRYTDEQVLRILKSHDIRQPNLDSVLPYSDGIPGRAMDLINKADFHKMREMVAMFIFNTESTADCELNSYLSDNKEAFEDCLMIVESLLRDALVAAAGKTDGLINSDKKDNIEKYALKIGTQELIKRIFLLEDIKNGINSYMNYQLAVDTLTLLL